MEVATQAKCAHSCTWPGIQGKVCALRQALLMASSSMRNWPQWLQRLEDLQFAVYMLETQESQERNSAQVGRSTDLEGGSVTSSLRPMAWKTGPCCPEQEKMDVQSQQTASMAILCLIAPCLGHT